MGSIDPNWYQPHVLSGGIAKANRGRKSPGYCTADEALPWYTVYVLDNGKMELAEAGGNAHILRGPAVVILRPGIIYEVSIPHLSDYAWIEWGFHNDALEPRVNAPDYAWGQHASAWRYTSRRHQPSFVAAGGADIPQQLPPDFYAATRLLCQRVNGLWWRSQLDWYRANNLLGEWLLTLWQHYGLFGQRALNTHDDIERCFAIARKQIEQILTVEKWASMLHISRKTLNNRLLAATGRTAKQHLDSIRLENAIQRLKALRPISEVAKFSGFGSRTSFTRWFKAATGTAPSAWREQHLGE